MAKLDYFYGAQVERVMKHLIRLFGNFQVLNNYDDNGDPVYRRVPCRYGDISRQFASIIQNASENTLKSSPFMTVSVSRLQMSREQVRAPLTEDIIAAKNKFNSATGQYENELDGIYQIKRQNPVPWELEFNVDIWTTTLENKFELMEQIGTLFNPTLELQLSENPYDWTSKMTVENIGYNYSSRSFPQGTEYNLDISTFTFKTTMWMSLPVSVSRATIIKQIVNNFQTPEVNADKIIPPFLDIATDVYAPSNHCIKVYRDSTCGENEYLVKLLNTYKSSTSDGKPEASDFSNVFSWDVLFTYYYGSVDYNVENNVQVRLLNSIEGENPQSSVPIGIVSEASLTSAPNVIKILVDEGTVESTNKSPVQAIIDPRKYDYNDVSNKPDGTRFLIHDSVDKFNLKLWNNDNVDLYIYGSNIAEKINGQWTVIESQDGDVLDNLTRGTRYKFSNEYGWFEIIKSIYSTGLWRLAFPLK